MLVVCQKNRAPRTQKHCHQPAQRTFSHATSAKNIGYPHESRQFFLLAVGSAVFLLEIQENQYRKTKQHMQFKVSWFQQNHFLAKTHTHTYIYIYIYITTLFVIVQIFIDSVIQIIIKIITATTAATKNYIKIITNIQKITLSAWKRAFFKTCFFKQMCWKTECIDTVKKSKCDGTCYELIICFCRSVVLMLTLVFFPFVLIFFVGRFIIIIITHNTSEMVWKNNCIDSLRDAQMQPFYVQHDLDIVVQLDHVVNIQLSIRVFVQFHFFSPAGQN